MSRNVRARLMKNPISVRMARERGTEVEVGALIKICTSELNAAKEQWCFKKHKKIYKGTWLVAAPAVKECSETAIGRGRCSENECEPGPTRSCWSRSRGGPTRWRMRGRGWRGGQDGDEVILGGVEEVKSRINRTTGRDKVGPRMSRGLGLATLTHGVATRAKTPPGLREGREVTKGRLDSLV